MFPIVPQPSRDLLLVTIVSATLQPISGEQRASSPHGGARGEPRLRRAKTMGENQQPMLRSINNAHRSYVKFVNKTLHHVVLYWIDYQGQAVSYGVLRPDDYRNIDTFVTHPWIFVDKETQDRFTVNQRDVFFPEPWNPSSRGLRRYVYITLPVYTLRELSLRAIKRCLVHHRQAFELDIPRSLQLELANMLPKNEEDLDKVQDP